MQDSVSTIRIPDCPDARYVGKWAGEGWAISVMAQLGSRLRDTRFFLKYEDTLGDDSGNDLPVPEPRYEEISYKARVMRLIIFKRPPFMFLNPEFYDLFRARVSRKHRREEEWIRFLG